MTIIRRRVEHYEVTTLHMLFYGRSLLLYTIKELPRTFTLVSCLAYSSTLNMETCSSETSADFERITRRLSPSLGGAYSIGPKRWS
jgi:hypothetical protein